MAESKRSKRSRRSAKAKASRPPGKKEGAGAPKAEAADTTGKPAQAPGAGKPSSVSGKPAATTKPEGTLDFNLETVINIVAAEVNGTEGIAELTGGWRAKGVQVEEIGAEGATGTEVEYDIVLRIAVEYGVNCVALAETVRSRVAGAVRQMTGRKTKSINIHVTGIREKGHREEPHEGVPLGEEHGIDF